MMLHIGKIRIVVAITMLAVGGVASSAPVPTASAACDESCLLGLASDYLDALTANDPGSIAFTPTARSTENGVVMKPGEGIWKTATSWPYRHTMADPVTGNVVVLGVANEGKDADGKPKDAFVVVRLKFAGRSISETELMVTRQGEFSLFNPRALAEPKPIFDAFVPADRRETRAKLAAVASNYFEGIISGDPARSAFHPDCNRIENGYQTTNNPDRLSKSCAEGLKHLVYMHAYRQVRIPIIDPARGLVLAITAFDMPKDSRTIIVRGKPTRITPETQHLPRTLFLYELFKVQDGRIRSIEAMMRNMPIGADMGWAGEKGNANSLTPNGAPD